jgi:predicted HTH transcriptional regulator
MPIGNSDAELTRLLLDLESDLVERKECWSGDAPDKGRQAVCAFANDLPDHRQPGVLFVGAVTAENFGQPGLTDYRNPNLADAMKTLGFVQRFGVGITLAQAELRKNGNPPIEFQVTNTSVLAVIRRKP